MIRPALPEDLDALVALERAGFGETAWSRGSLRAQLEDPGSWVAVAPADGPVEASITVRIAVDEAELLRIVVLPEARRTGLARALIAAGTSWLEARGARRLFLEVSARNHAAEALYRGQGFVTCGRRRGYYGPDEDALLLELPLTPGSPA